MVIHDVIHIMVLVHYVIHIMVLVHDAIHIMLLVHDVGMLNRPDAVLVNVGRGSAIDEEVRLLHGHSIYCVSFLLSISLQARTSKLIPHSELGGFSAFPAFSSLSFLFSFASFSSSVPTYSDMQWMRVQALCAVLGSKPREEIGEKRGQVKAHRYTVRQVRVVTCHVTRV